MGNNRATNDDLLRKAQWGISMRLLPVMVSLWALILMGVIGNILTIVFYVKRSKRTTPVILIICLAVADLATCVTAIPIISEMATNVRYSQIILCKLAHFAGLWAGACSSAILWTISIDRYRKVCRPLGKQMTVTTVKYLVIGITSISLLLSVRMLVTFDAVNVNITIPNMNETVVGSFCAAREEQEYKLVGLVFYLIDFILVVMVWMTVVVTYSKIIYTIARRRISMGNSFIRSQREQRVKQSRKIKGKCSVEEDEITNHGRCYSRDINSLQFDDTSLSESNTDKTHKYAIAETNGEQRKQQVNNSSSQMKKLTFAFASAKKPSELNLTLMMFAVSMIFILCLTPYFVIRIFIRIVLVTGNEYDFSAGIQFALKLPYLNSAFNPVIYCIFNPKFRRYIKVWFGKCSFGKKYVNATEL
ncbi:cholecystokinin receptor type A-like [Mercenaria mercenaria]|uniref:cholecystokinin receptor type A-like n=1 Tax=Mercenaria mercenaria TaxID=6596 RepID=UPI00234F9376|nr:cholecystokinin receptor type A-like [Mercenaria mercenaria]